MVIPEVRCSTGTMVTGGSQKSEEQSAEGQGSGPLRDALCLLEATRLKGMTP